MILIATLFKDIEIILPEIAALTTGIFIYQDSNWICEPTKIFLAPSITAIVGFLINLLSMNYVSKILLVLLFVIIFLKLLSCALAPSFATGLLPIIVNANHVSFIVATLSFTFILMISVHIRGSHRKLHKGSAMLYRNMAVYTGLILIWALVVIVFQVPQMIGIPPVLVVLYEVLQKPKYHFNLAIKQIIALTGSATIGFLVYLNFKSWLIISLVSLPLVFLLLQLIKVKVPAAYAFPILAIVLPKSMLMILPVSSFLASSFFLISVVCYRKLVPNIN
ncbi:hypothetical protein GSH19_05440 [Lactobacillus sp. S2-2]|nr:hypothetical protein [Lactobacillus sp. S2-2]